MTSCKLLIAALLAFAFNSALAETPTPEWIVGNASGCRVWLPIPEPNEKASWDGPCQNGVAEGHGQLRWYTNNLEEGRYDGELRDGKMVGNGLVTFSNGSTYVGELRDNVANGSGVYVTPEGITVSGVWKDGCLSAQGYNAFVGWNIQTCGVAQGK